jgi:hypothetical protein
MRCNTVLTATAPVNVHPPRAGWTRHFRPFLYRLNALNDAIPSQIGKRFDKSLSQYFLGSSDLLWFALSIIPGLGHLLTGRLRNLRLVGTGYVAAMLLGLALWGTGGGSLLIGLAIALHGWIMLDAGRLLDGTDTLRSRLVVGLVVYVMLAWVVYGGINRHWVGGVVTPVPIPSHGIRQDDFLIIWRQAYLLGSPQRGDLVMYRTKARPLNYGHGAIKVGETLGRLLAFPGEKVNSSGAVLTVTTPEGKVTRYGSPILKDLNFEMIVPAGRYLCFPVDVKIAIQGAAVSPEEIIDMIGLPSTNEFHGRAIMIYNTIFRTAWLPHIPLEPVK